MRQFIYTFLLISFFSFVLAKEKGILGTEIQLFKIVLPKGQKLDLKVPIPEAWLKPLGESKQSIINVLGNPDYFEIEETSKEYLKYNLGPTFWFWPDYLDSFEAFAFGIRNGTTSDFVLSKKYQIRPGVELSQLLLDTVEYTAYPKPDNTVVLVFNVVRPDGDFATNLLSIRVKNNKVVSIYYGYSE